MKQLGAFWGIMILILDSKTAVNGALEGMELCLKVIIPSLFPFFILTTLLTGSMEGSRLSLLVSGFLGGYPAGAQSIALAWRSGTLSWKEAERMLAWCSNAGPAFLFGIAAQQFSAGSAAWILWGIHILSAIFVSWLFPVDIPKRPQKIQSSSVTLTAAMQTALRTTASVCGWILLFRIILTFLTRWCLWLLPTTGQVAVAGILELSNGCTQLHMVADERTRFLLCSGLLAFGGCCVTMQTASVTQGLSLKYYLSGKLMQTIFSLVLSFAIAYRYWLPSLLLIAFIFWKRFSTQKRGSIPGFIGV